MILLEKLLVKLYLGVVTDHGPCDLFTIQLFIPYIFLTQNCIKLEPGYFRAQPLDYPSQILRSFTAPILIRNKCHCCAPPRIEAPNIYLLTYICRTMAASHHAEVLS